MKSKGFNQISIARALDTSHTALNRFLNGKNDTYATTLLNIFEKLDIDIIQLLEAQLKNPNQNKSTEDRVASDISKILQSLSPLQKKTLLSTIIQNAKRDKNLETETNSLINYRNSINTVIKGGTHVRSRTS